MSRPVVAVVDTGVDDALALVVAVRHPAIDLRGVVATAGNVGLGRAVANTRLVLDLLESDAPVVAGAARRLDGTAFPGRAVHGPDGLAGLGPPDDAECDPAVTTELATLVADAFVVCLGPLTSLAGVRARRVVASYAHRGEANHAMDPAAAEIVGHDVVDVPVHPMPVLVAPVRDRPGGPGDRAWALVHRLLGHQARRGAGLGDAAVMLMLAEPGLPPRDWAGRVGSLASTQD